MTAERRVPGTLSRRRLITSGVAAGGALAGGLLTGCSGSAPATSTSSAGHTTQASSPAAPPSPPPSALSALKTPVGFADIPFKGGKRQPAMVKVLKPDDYFTTDPQPLWSFTGDHGWSSFNGFKFRTMGSQTVALLIGSAGHIAIVPAEPSVKAATTTADLIWHSPKQRSDNPHAAELVPAGDHEWPGGHAAAPNLLVVASPEKLAVYDLEANTEWEMPFDGGHGALWDPRAKRLWALGSSNLSSYRLQRYGDKKGTGEVAKHTGTGWGLGGERRELEAPGLGHDLQPDYSSKGTHLLMTTPDRVFRIPKKHPDKKTELTLAAGPDGKPSYQGSQRVKSIVRSKSGLYVWVRLQAHGFNPNAVYTDNAISVGKAASGGKVPLLATLRLPTDNWTYKARLFVPDYF